MTDARIVTSAGGLSREFNAAGVLAPADVHVARRLTALAGEADETVALAVALAVRGPRLGHVYVDLATIRETATVDSDEPIDLSALPWPDTDEWLAKVTASPVLDGPLKLEGSSLYLDRYWREERQVAADLRALAEADAPPVDEAALAAGIAQRLTDPLQALAAETAVRRRFAVVAGGPWHRQDDDRRPHRRAAARAAAERADRARRTDRRRRRAADRRDARGRPGRHRGADAASPARLAAGRAQPFPPRSWQPAAARRGDRRRDVDGLAVADGAARRGGAARRAADPRRRPRAAHLDRGRRRARRHRRGRRAARRRARRGLPLRRAHRRLAAAIREGNADATVAALAGVTWIDDLEASLEPVRERAVATARAVTAAAERGDGAEALAQLRRFRSSLRAPPRPLRRQRLDRPHRGVGRGPAAATGTSAGRCS